jgi:hypothetical protein
LAVAKSTRGFAARVGQERNVKSEPTETFCMQLEMQAPIFFASFGRNPLKTLDSEK